MSRCKICGQVMIDDMEVGQGHCVTAPCWMYAKGQLDLAQEWEEKNPGFWAQADIEEGLTHLCECCGCEPGNPDEPCPICYDEETEAGIYYAALNC